MTEGNGGGANGGSAERPEVQRAEELLEDWGERLGRWLSRTTERVKEEAEDIWAEAQSIRRR